MPPSIKRPIVLILVRFYLPGYRGGGPIRTIANMVDQLSEDFDFRIITSGHDLGCDNPYDRIDLDAWVAVGNAKVYYCSRKALSPWRLLALIKQQNYDLLYLNSFFDPLFSILPQAAARLGLIKQLPILLAPRGEFSEGAVELKKRKKGVYLWAFSLFLKFKLLHWHASSNLEKQDILRMISWSKSNFADSILIALDVPAKPAPINHNSRQNRTTDSLRLVFLSRISPKKNLLFAIELLAQIKIPVIYDIYGPIEDARYWKKCVAAMERLPQNILVNYKGEISHNEVNAILAKYDLFFFPTLGENFGHVIHESLAAGTPVLISDQTPWVGLSEKGAGWELPLGDAPLFGNAILHYSQLSDSEKRGLSLRGQDFVNSTGGEENIQDNKSVLWQALSRQSLFNN
jgi:glycosyltransferase involved in cell wall biosynthesis